jgi:hypothetical protein
MAGQATIPATNAGEAKLITGQDAALFDWSSH